MSAQHQSDRIEELFLRVGRENRAAFVSYLCAGDPDPETSYRLCRAVIDGGADLLELGVPFSDPLADGRTNQLAAERALAAGVRQEDVFALVKRLRGDFRGPIVFYTYFNLVFSTGIRAYVRKAKEAGVDALLCLDLPPEEAAEYLEICREEGMGTVFIVAPTTPAERLKTIVGCATAFIYYVTREGVTGVRTDMASGFEVSVARIRSQTGLPVVVGFGISNRDQVRATAAVADGVVVGSVLVNGIERTLGDPDRMVEEMRLRTEDLCAGLMREA